MLSPNAHALSRYAKGGPVNKEKLVSVRLFERTLLTVSASHMRTVQSLLAVYNTPFFPPLPPHFTTFTLAVWPPSVYSARRVVVDHTRTVPSFDEEAKRGVVGFLRSTGLKDSLNSGIG